MFHAEIISIIAGGRSVRQVDQSRIPGLVIGVNDSFIHAECDVCVSMDRLWTENRWTAIMYEEKPTYLRKAALLNIHERTPLMFVYDCDIYANEFSENWDNIGGNNSASCAMNFAYLARPLAIYLFGFDMTGSYWYPNYSWNPKPRRGLGHWVKQFDRARSQCDFQGIEVINVSDVSLIKAFKTVTPKEFNSRR